MAVAQPSVGQPGRPSRLSQYWKSISIIFDSRVATVGLIIVLFWVIIGFISLFWTPYPPNASLFDQNLMPNATNWLGTDHLGRDIASRLMTGTQVILLKTRIPTYALSSYLYMLGVIAAVVALFALIGVIQRARARERTTTRSWITLAVSIIVAVVATLLANQFSGIMVPRFSIPIGVALWGVFLALVFGAILGLNAAYRGGWWDQGIMQVLDALVAFPAIVLYLVIITALQQSDIVVILAITITGIPGIARLVRSLALDIKTRDYIRAAETRGESISWIMFREILPNARGPVMVDAMLRVGYAIFAIGTLGFLGVGLPPPDPDWGNMVNEARRFIFVHAWAVIPPAIAIASLVVGLNLFADGLREETTRYQK